MENEKKDNVVQMKPEFTDLILHERTRELLEHMQKCEAMKSRIYELKNKIEAARFMPDAERRIPMHQAEIAAIMGAIAQTTLELLTESSMVTLHALHMILYPDRPRILTERPRPEPAPDSPPAA